MSKKSYAGGLAKKTRRLLRKVIPNKRIKDALELAIAECIQKGILAELLTDHQSEVKHMLLTEYNPKKHIRQEREEAREEGWNSGCEHGRQEGIERTAANMLQDGMSPEKVAQLTGLTIERVEKLKSEFLQNC